MLKIGHMSYINIFPLYQHMDGLVAEYITGVPSALNAALRRGDLDVSPVSSLEYAVGRDDYLILKDVGICACKEVKSVILFSGLPIEELSGKKIYLSSQSLTSVNLLKLILSHFCNIKPDYTDLRTDAAASLLIGDDALREYCAHEPERYVYDLAALWYEYTGLPFVFSLWLARPEALPMLTELHTILREAAPNIGRNAETYADMYIKRHGEIFSKEILVDYWNTLYYAPSDEEYQSLRLYYEMLGYSRDLRLI